jgi:hypothetical protein
VVGSYIKINLLGKPVEQFTDKQFYIALRYVGVQGITINEMSKYPAVKQSFTEQYNTDVEEEKSSLLPQSEIEGPDLKLTDIRDQLTILHGKDVP